MSARTTRLLAATTVARRARCAGAMAWPARAVEGWALAEELARGTPTAAGADRTTAIAIPRGFTWIRRRSGTACDCGHCQEAPGRAALGRHRAELWMRPRGT